MGKQQLVGAVSSQWHRHAQVVGQVVVGKLHLVAEQAAIYARLDEQCKRYLGKGCEELLAEAGRELEEESS